MTGTEPSSAHRGQQKLPTRGQKIPIDPTGSRRRRCGAPSIVGTSGSKTGRDQVEIIPLYEELGRYRAVAVLLGCDHKTVKPYERPPLSLGPARRVAARPTSIRELLRRTRDRGAHLNEGSPRRATFETEPRSTADIDHWLMSAGGPALVATCNGVVAGWARISRYTSGPCYAGCYVRASERGDLAERGHGLRRDERTVPRLLDADHARHRALQEGGNAPRRSERPRCCCCDSIASCVTRPDGEHGRTRPTLVAAVPSG